MENKELAEIIEKHKKWINGEDDGIKADLHGADLHRADLRGADLYEADLRGADLRGADLRGADLQGADLHRADLYAADLRGADLHGADLHGADFDFSSLNFSCKGIGLHFDERIIKQLLNHALKQSPTEKIPEYEKIKKFVITNKDLYAWLENWHRKKEVKSLDAFIKE